MKISSQRSASLLVSHAPPLFASSPPNFIPSGQINKHKNSQTSDHHTQHIPPSARSNSYPSMTPPKFDKHIANSPQDFAQPNAAWRPNRGGYPSRGYRGGRPAPVHRNRTLVLNGNATSENNPPPQNTENVKPSSGPAWVTKKDRHLQLINTNIYEQESQSRAKAMEESRKQKLLQRDAREKTKFNKHLQHLAVNAANYEINVQGIQFRVANNGSKLVKVPGERSPTVATYHRHNMCTQGPGLLFSGDLNAAKATPKTALVGGVRFYRSKNGNMYRSGIIKAHRYGRLPSNLAWMSQSPLITNLSGTRKNATIKKINEPCKMFTTTGSSFLPRVRLILHDIARWRSKLGFS